MSCMGTTLWWAFLHILPSLPLQNIFQTNTPKQVRYKRYSGTVVFYQLHSLAKMSSHFLSFCSHTQNMGYWFLFHVPPRPSCGEAAKKKGNKWWFCIKILKKKLTNWWRSLCIWFDCELSEKRKMVSCDCFQITLWN